MEHKVLVTFRAGTSIIVLHFHVHLPPSLPPSPLSPEPSSMAPRRQKARIPPIALKRKAPGSLPSAKRGGSVARLRLSPSEVRQVFAAFHAFNPEPKGELEHVNAFTLLVAVVLSAQATDAGVNKATRALFKIADTPEQMLRLGEDRVRDFVKTIGLFRTKAKNIIALSERLVTLHNGTVPHDREALEALPGVGRKTANVVLNIAFGEPTMAVDTHVFRVANRIGLSAGQNPLAVEKDLMKIVPAEFGMHAHHWLILHGRYLCKARKPECWRCPIAQICRFGDKTPNPA
jgi:endonuclease III